MTAPLKLLALALDPRVQTPDDATSEQILDAALAVGAESGLRNLTMEEVARRAGVGRVTVYRRFDDRDRLLEALAVRECRRGLAALKQVFERGGSVEQIVADVFVTALRLAREHPLASRTLRLEPEYVLATLRAHDGQLLGLLRGAMTAQVRAGQKAGVVSAELDPDLAAEVAVRLGLSYLLLPEGMVRLDDEAACRALVHELVVPIVTGRAPRRKKRSARRHR